MWLTNSNHVQVTLLHWTIELNDTIAAATLLEGLKVQAISGHEACLSLDSEVVTVGLVENILTSGMRSSSGGCMLGVIVMSMIATRRHIVWGNSGLLLLSRHVDMVYGWENGNPIVEPVWEMVDMDEEDRNQLADESRGISSVKW